MSGIFIKDPAAKEDFTIDWSDFLNGDTIPSDGSSTWSVPSGITQHSISRTTTTTTIWLTGGTHGEEYVVTNQITTNGARIAERSIKIICRNR